MKVITALSTSTIMLLALGLQTLGQVKRVPQRPTANELPKVIKFQGKGMQPPLLAGAVKKPRPKAPPPLSPAILLSLYQSMGITGPPQKDEYLMLTARHPYVDGRGSLEAQNTPMYAADDDDIYFEPNAIAIFRMTPAAVGQSYLIDITLQVMSSPTGLPAFHVITPDQSDNTMAFSKIGVQHVLLTFTSSSTTSQAIQLSSSSGEWIFHSCKVTLLK